MTGVRRRHSSEFKAKVALEALKGQQMSAYRANGSFTHRFSRPTRSISVMFAQILCTKPGLRACPEARPNLLFLGMPIAPAPTAMRHAEEMLMGAQLAYSPTEDASKRFSGAALARPYRLSLYRPMAGEGRIE